MKPLRAARYRRISEDPEGLELGIERQDEDTHEHIEVKGYLFDRERHDYVDNDIGASTRGRQKNRPDYNRMLRDARAGEWDVLVAYTQGRVTRRPRENEDLIELAEQCGIRYDWLRSPSFDLNTADGRMIARVIAAADTAEVERMSERMMRQARQQAEMGLQRSSQRPYGWTSSQGDLIPEEANMLRAAADYILSGGYISKVIKSWEEKGVLTARGRRWSSASLRGALVAPRIAGFASYRGELVVDKAGHPAKGNWEPILNEDTWRALCALLDSRKNTQPYRTYLLSGVLRCAECGSEMNGARVNEKRWIYKCYSPRPGHGASVSGDPVDALIEKYVLWKLRGRQTELPEREWDGEELLADAVRQKDEIWAAYKAKVIGAGEAFPQIGELEAEIKSLTQKRAAAARMQLPPSEALTMWESGDVLQRRAVVRRLLSTILVHPAAAQAKGSKRQFDAARVEPVERES